jgi:hypothetical protein
MEKDSQYISINWEKCVLWQSGTKENLQCPADSKRYNLGAGYSSLAKNIEKFHQLSCLPIKPMKLLTVYGTRSSDIEVALHQHKGKWHKKCRDSFNNLKLERAEKRKHTEDISEATRKSTRKAGEASRTQCFFCDEESEDMHRVSTKSLDDKVRNCAQILEDT